MQWRIQLYHLVAILHYQYPTQSGYIYTLSTFNKIHKHLIVIYNRFLYYYEGVTSNHITDTIYPLLNCHVEMYMFRFDFDSFLELTMNSWKNKNITAFPSNSQDFRILSFFMFLRLRNERHGCLLLRKCLKFVAFLLLMSVGPFL